MRTGTTGRHWLAARRSAVFLALAPAGWAAEKEAEFLSIPVTPETVIRQQAYPDSPNGCGPTALANCLKFGPPPFLETWDGLVGGDDSTRLRFLIDRWFAGRQSGVYPGKKRLSFDGTLEEDLAAAAAEIATDHRLDRMRGDFLDRRAGEKSPAFLARVHGAISDSIRRGVPPLLSLKTFVARRIERMDHQVAWEAAAHHWVVVTGVRRELRPADLGFSIDLIDPDGGHLTSAYLFAENRLNFRALKGTEERGQWLDGRPFLLVQAPGVLALRPDEAQWRDRIIVTANFLIAPTGDLGAP